MNTCLTAHCFVFLSLIEGLKSWGVFQYVAALIVLITVFLAVYKILRRLIRPVKTARMQLALIDRDNGEAARNLRIVPGQTSHSRNISMGRSMIDNTYLTFYLIDKKNKTIKLKTPSENIQQMREGDLCTVTYQGEDLISYQKTGSIQDQDQKPVHFQY